MNLSKLKQELKYVIQGPDAVPGDVVWFLTERCNLRCPFCFVANASRRARSEMTLADIRQFISNSKSAIRHVTLTGGEVMVRKDIFDIITLLQDNGVATSVSTNGLRARELVDFIREHGANIRLQTSLDGPEDLHNKIRGTQDAFRNAIDLIELGRQVTNIAVVTTFTRLNYDAREEIFKLVADYGVAHSINFVRTSDHPNGGDRNDFRPVQGNDLSMAEIGQVIEDWKKYARKHMTYSDFLSQKVRLATVQAFMRNGKWPYRCAAGYKQAVLYSDGGVSLCESLVPFTSLQDHELSWAQVWKNEEPVLKDCFCQWDCAMLNSMSKSARGWAVLLWHMLR